MSNPNDPTGKGPQKPGSEAGDKKSSVEVKITPSDGRTGGDAKKPAAIIDLKATEIKVSATAKPGDGPSMANAKPQPQSPPYSSSAKVEPAKVEPGKGATSTSAAAAKSAVPDTSAKSKPQDAGKAAVNTPPPARSGSAGRFFTHLAAGLLGGFISLLALDKFGADMGLQNLGGRSAAISDDLKQRLAAIEARADAAAKSVEPGVADKLKAAEVRLSELKTQIAGLIEGQSKLGAATKSLSEKAATVAPMEPETASRMQRLEETLRTIAAAAGTDAGRGRVPEIAAISGKVADLEQTLGTQVASLRKSIGQEIEARLGRTAESAEAARSGAERLDRDLQTSRADQAKLTQRVEDLKANSDKLAATVQVVSQDTAALKSGLTGLKSDLERELKSVARPQDVSSALEPVTQRLAKLDTSVAGVMKSETDRSASAGRILLTLELANLKRALDRGGAYAAELASVDKASGGKLDLAALQAFKDKGLPALGDLARDFKPLANAILDAEAEQPNATIVDRLIGGAKSIVRVRKVAYADTDTSTEATIGRMEKALGEAKLGDVLTNAKALPPKAAPKLQGWLDRVEARAAVDRGVATIEAQLKSTIEATAAPDKATK